MSNTVPLQAFLPGKSFVIPDYQRDYSWGMKQVEELLSDIEDVIENGISHYLGTVVLVQIGNQFQIVDGQQRLSTIILLLEILLSSLPQADQIRLADELYLLNSGSNPKLDFGRNKEFVALLQKRELALPRTRGQRSLEECYRYMLDRVHSIAIGGKSRIYLWLDTIKRLEIIPFIEVDSGRAIRIFQSVNDRGKPLTSMDKAKALLVFYSNSFLKSELDLHINEVFGVCFTEYDSVKELAIQDGFKIESINRVSFSEDDLLRYHYLAYNNKQFIDFHGYKNTVLDDFLKVELKQRQNNPDELKAFIIDYANDLKTFSESFSGMIRAARMDRRLFTLLIIHRLAARLWPLAIRLFQRNLLISSQTEFESNLDLLKCLEVVDLRIYKIRGTDPARDIGRLTHRSRVESATAIANGLREFLKSFMPDTLMRTALSGDMYGNGSVVPILLAFEQINSKHDLAKLVKLVAMTPTQEHVIPQSPDFDFMSAGFETPDDFNGNLHCIGNLTLLTDKENKRCSNNSPQSKMSQPEFYFSSEFTGPKELAHQIRVAGKSFDKNQLISRKEKLISFAIENWRIW